MTDSPAIDAQEANSHGFLRSICAAAGGGMIAALAWLAVAAISGAECIAVSLGIGMVVGIIVRSLAERTGLGSVVAALLITFALCVLAKPVVVYIAAHKHANDAADKFASDYPEELAGEYGFSEVEFDLAARQAMYKISLEYFFGDTPLYRHTDLIWFVGAVFIAIAAVIVPATLLDSI